MSRKEPQDLVPKEYRQIVRAARAAGWTTSQTRHGHLKLRHPDGSYSIPLPSSSGASGTRKSVVVMLRAHGLETT